MKKYKIKLKVEMLEALHQLIWQVLQNEVDDDYERLLFSNLQRAANRCYDKLKNYQKEYTVTFSANEAIALRIFYVDYTSVSFTSSIGNKLRGMADEIHQLFTN